MSMTTMTQMVAAGFAAASLISSWAEAAELVVGSKAPPIDIAHWIQTREGAFQPVTEFAPGKVYVIEFWATWCGPCVAMMPHLAELQDTYVDKGVTIISVTDEEPQTVQDFLDHKIRDVLDANPGATETFREVTKGYCLTTDPDGSVTKDYMEAAGQIGVPVAFIVGKTGEIEWIGHPTPSVLDALLEEIVAGTFDRAAGYAPLAKEMDVYNKRLEPIGALLQGDDPMRAIALIDEVLADCDNERHKQRLVWWRKAWAAMAARSSVRLTLQKTLRKGGPEAIEAFGGLVAAAGDSAKRLNEAARAVVEAVEQEEHVSEELLAAARAAAEKAVKLAPGNFINLDTLAHLEAAHGDIEKAIATQQKAAQHAAAGPAAAQVRGYLESLQAKAKP